MRVFLNHPNKALSMKKRYNISLSSDARKKLEAMAEKEKRSLSMMIEVLILKGEVKK